MSTLLQRSLKFYKRSCERIAPHEADLFEDGEKQILWLRYGSTVDPDRQILTWIFGAVPGRESETPSSLTEGGVL